MGKTELFSLMDVKKCIRKYALFYEITCPLSRVLFGTYPFPQKFVGRFRSMT